MPGFLGTRFSQSLYFLKNRDIRNVTLELSVDATSTRTLPFQSKVYGSSGDVCLLTFLQTVEAQDTNFSDPIQGSLGA